MNIPAHLRYTSSHEWLRREADGTLTVGITDHAQGALGDLVFIELPAVGRKVAAGEACAVVESVKAASDVYAPIAGEIVAANDGGAGDAGAREPGRVRGMAVPLRPAAPSRDRRAARRARLPGGDRRRGP